MERRDVGQSCLFVGIKMVHLAPSWKAMRASYGKLNGVTHIVEIPPFWTT